MARLTLIWLLSTAMPAGGPQQPALERFEFTQVEMAAPIRIVLYAPDRTAADKGAKAAFARVHQLSGLMSDYDPQSELRQFCLTAGQGKPVTISDDLWRVLCQAQRLSDRCGGAFDVTVAPVVKLWRRARRRGQLPSAKRLEEARKLVDYRLLRLGTKQRTAELLKPGMRLDLGGIAKGLAADEALAVLRRQGITRALVDAGGDLRLGDPPPGKPGWRIGVAALEADAPPQCYLWLRGVAIATSGDTWQYVEIGGRRYSHIVDPRTGLGLTDRSSVTVIAPDCTTADGLASAVSVLGPEAGLKLIDRTPGAAALILRAPDGTLQTYESRRWKDLPAAPPATR